MKKFDPHALRREFPIFNRKIFGKPLTYLDSAASAQKPRILLESLKSFFEKNFLHQCCLLNVYIDSYTEGIMLLFEANQVLLLLEVQH